METSYGAGASQRDGMEASYGAAHQDGIGTTSLVEAASSAQGLDLYCYWWCSPHNQRIILKEYKGGIKHSSIKMILKVVAVKRPA